MSSVSSHLPSYVSPYAPLIAEATHAPASDLAMLESIMRSEVFHSTLDWQSAEELRDGARRALDLLEGDRQFYELSAQQKRIMFHHMKACEEVEQDRHRVSEMRASGNVGSRDIRQAEKDLEKAERHLAKLDEELESLAQRLRNLPS